MPLILKPRKRVEKIEYPVVKEIVYKSTVDRTWDFLIKKEIINSDTVIELSYLLNCSIEDSRELVDKFVNNTLFSI